MRAMGVDFGRRRIGLALSDATGLLARPWKVIPGSASVEDVAATLVAELDQLDAAGEHVDAIVLGLPRRLSGEANEQTRDVRKLRAALSKLVAVDVVLQDERLSSYEAERMMAERIKDWRKRKPLLDSAAAAIILQDYLDNRERGSRTSGEDETQ